MNAITHELKELNQRLTRKADRQINYFLACYFGCGLLLAIPYDTWVIATGVGALCLVAYYSAKLLLPHSNVYQYVLSTIMGVFMAQYIYQMHGLFEMHFLAFIGSAILITYRNWKLQIPLALVVIIHHAAFGYLQYIGYDKIYFTQLGYMSLETFLIHGFLATVIFFLCGLWAYNFKVAAEQQAAQASEIETIFHRVDEALFSYDPVIRKVLKISAASERIFGYTPSEIMHDDFDWEKIIYPDDRYIVAENEARLQSGNSLQFHYRIIHRDRSVRWVEVKLIPTLSPFGTVVRADGICKDITEKVDLEKKLSGERKLKQQQITAAVITAQENERAFLGQELHDNINPTLATAMLYIDSALADGDNRIERLKESKGFINSALNEIRDLSKSLVPHPVKAISLKDTIRDMLYHVNQMSRINVEMEFDGIDESILPDKLKLTLYRILQEQVNNILKHAQAQTIIVQLSEEDGTLQLTIKDDGIGFDVTQARDGVGLQNITSRTDLFNGNVIINSSPGEGCELIVRFNNSSLRTV
ncbi:sensor histidine kinase [Flavihumibacter petaseus]|uniref:histidine kinase n=1 Tax=Flavihumibacter petaseus NBRC 106054 TaxID=1220578 RepID=A0A0E9N4D6_9BACT|nr:PAS domain-containing protein [Flavihumibacter petaseus]GAO44689.1 putative two-component histidine kinase [Flavihumibacter petaseus NBRC 106054]